MEHLIDSYGLTIHNRGKLPTYECKLGQSIIDVTLSQRLPLKLENWRVNRTFNGSDHNTILYQLVTDIIELPPYRNYEKEDWNKFTMDLQQVEIYKPQVFTQKKLDKMVQKLTYTIEEATENCCPMMPAKKVNKNNPWWTPQINDLRKEVNALYTCLLYTSPSPRD